MDDNFEISEKLYRAVIPNDIYVKPDGSISSAAFKSTNGCSVDRGDGRTDLEVVTMMQKKLKGNIYNFQVKDCRDKEIYIKYEPVEGTEDIDDIYHCGLYKNNMLDKMTSSQCKYLSNVAKLVEIS